MAQQERARGLGQNLQTAASNQAGANAGAWSQLAMRGGLQGGSRERMAESGANNLMAQQQQMRASSEGDASNIRLQDEQNRLAQLENLPSMYNAMQDPNKFNMQSRQNLLGNQQGFRADLAKSGLEQKGNTLAAWMAMQGAKYA
jgi:hypothetical protein